MRGGLLGDFPSSRCYPQVGVRSRVWGTSFGDLTIESFNSTRTGLESSAEGSLTRCVVGHQEGGGAILPKLKLDVEDASQAAISYVVIAELVVRVQHVVWGG